jgi:hypothetical protein
MFGRWGSTALTALAALAVAVGCSTTISGAPTWPGARLERAVLTAPDFPPGVAYDRIVDAPGTPDGAGGPPAMMSKPAGCSNGLTNVIADSAERGPGSAVKYGVAYDGARIVMTVLSWRLNLDRLAATAARCERFEAFFDPTSDGIPITTTKLAASDEGLLVYQQTMDLHAQQRSVFMAFENVGAFALFGVAFPADDPSVPVKASLPQTFLDIVSKQADRMRAV